MREFLFLLLVSCSGVSSAIPPTLWHPSEAGDKIAPATTCDNKIYLNLVQSCANEVGDCETDTCETPSCTALDNFKKRCGIKN